MVNRYQVRGLSWLNMKARSAARVLGCGMSLMAELFFDVCDAPLGEQQQPHQAEHRAQV